MKHYHVGVVSIDTGGGPGIRIRESAPLERNEALHHYSHLAMQTVETNQNVLVFMKSADEVLKMMEQTKTHQALTFEFVGPYRYYLSVCKRCLPALNN